MNDQTFAKIKESAAVRLKCTNQDHRLESISNHIPCDFISEIHGSPTRCYTGYTDTNVSKLRKCDYQPDQDFESLSSPNTSKRRRSATDPSSSTMFVL